MTEKDTALDVLLLNGPNLNLLGEREASLYGRMTLAEIEERAIQHGAALGMRVRAWQSNSQGALIDALHDARQWAAGVVFNPGAYAHTSLALRDAVAAIAVPVVEVHLTNVFAREAFRHRSLIAPACAGVIMGFGWHSYLLALQALAHILEEEGKPR
jgi:3-dehydroquinate dehydratase-2